MSWQESINNCNNLWWLNWQFYCLKSGPIVGANVAKSRGNGRKTRKAACNGPWFVLQYNHLWFVGLSFSVLHFYCDHINFNLFFYFEVLFLVAQLISSIIPPSFLLAQYKQVQSGLSKTSVDSKQDTNNVVSTCTLICLAHKP